MYLIRGCLSFSSKSQWNPLKISLVSINKGFSKLQSCTSDEKHTAFQNTTSDSDYHWQYWNICMHTICASNAFVVTQRGGKGSEMHKVLRCIAHVQAAAQDKKVFHSVAAARAGKTFWKIMTNITLSAHQGERVPCIWFMPHPFPSSPHWWNGGKLCCSAFYEPKMKAKESNIQLWNKVVSCVATYAGNMARTEMEIWKSWQKCISFFNRSHFIFKCLFPS